MVSALESTATPTAVELFVLVKRIKKSVAGVVTKFKPLRVITPLTAATFAEVVTVLLAPVASLIKLARAVVMLSVVMWLPAASRTQSTGAVDSPTPATTVLCSEPLFSKVTAEGAPGVIWII